MKKLEFRSALRWADHHKGDLFIIAGAGPSLKDYSTKDVSDHTVIAINNALCHFSKVDYFFAVDKLVAQEECWKKLYKANEIILTEEFKDLDITETYRNHKFNGTMRSASTWVMNKDSHLLVMGCDAVQSACHLAIIMGAKTIALIGCELDFSASNEKYFMTNPIGEQDMESLLRSQRGWKNIVKSNLGTLPIYNCAKNSKMPYIPIMPLDEIKEAYVNAL